MNEDSLDFFLYYKQWWFTRITFLMVIIFTYRIIRDRKRLPILPVFIPLALYALLAVISSLLSKYRDFCFSGIFEQFESLFAILGYCFIVYYVFLYVKNERAVRIIILSLIISALVLGLIGITQVIGKDIFSTIKGWRLITPKIYWNSKDDFTFNFAKQVYLTFYNPNYVGVYASLVIPLFVIIAGFAKKIWFKAICLLASLGIAVCLIGSKSTTGIISIAFAVLLSIIFFRRYLVKYFYITIPTIIVLLIAAFTLNHVYNNFFINQFNKVSHIQKNIPPTLSEIQTNDNNVTIKYNNNLLKIEFIVTEDEVCLFNLYDGDNLPVNYKMDVVNAPITVQDDRFPGFIITPCRNTDSKLGFTVTIDNYDWSFTNQVQDKTYYYITKFGKYDKIINTPSLFFKGYERIASNRGYIWSRSIPLLKDSILLGSGADTFSLVFPQSDYVNMHNFGFETQVMSKPHRLYLQIGVQTGVISLIAFIVFYMMYFFSSIKLYIKSKFDTYYSIVGVAILISTASYMISCLSNDSSITIAPIYWALMGLGIAVNQKAKENKKASLLHTN
jgi:hypothetical protein